ncbi:ATP-binding protein, partial [Thermodesulfobacteriota bacterium]
LLEHMTLDNKDKKKSKDQLIDELVALRQRISALEESGKNEKTDESLEDSREIDLEVLIEMKQLALEERYRALFENIPIETIIVDTNAKITGTNYTETTDETKGPRVGQVMYKDYAGKHKINMHNELMDCIKTGVPKEFQKQKYNDKFFHIWMAPFSGGAIITSIDATENVLVEEAMRKNHKRALFLAQILYNVSQPLVVAYSDGRLMTYNKAYANMTGYSNFELRNIKLFLDLIPSKWHDTIADATETMLQTEKLQRFEIECFHKDRSVVPVEMVEYPLIDNKGSPRSYYSLFTPLEKTEDEEDSQIDSWDEILSFYKDAPVMISVFDKRGSCIFWNDACEKWLGWEENEAVTGPQDILSFIHPDPIVLGNVKEIIKKPDKVFREYTVQTKDNSTRIQLWSAYSIKNNLTITIGYDITKWKSEEERLHQYIAELQEENADLSHYNIEILHDLRSPLYAIQNYTTFLREDMEVSLNEELKTYLNGLAKAVKEAREMTDGLLTLARIEKDVIPSEEISLGAFLRELLTSMDLHPDVHIAMKDDCPRLNIEPPLLRRIFWNLIDNAAKFNTSANKLIEIGWQPIENDHYEIFVRDNGIGIEHRFIEQIFSVFERLHTSDEYPGMGIGLAIVKKVVNKLGGSIRLDSVPGEGTTFTITLPKKSKTTKDPDSRKEEI